MRCISGPVRLYDPCEEDVRRGAALCLRSALCSLRYALAAAGTLTARGAAALLRGSPAVERVGGDGAHEQWVYSKVVKP